LPVRILGIDPGSRTTGYGVIVKDGPQLGYVACGTIRTTTGAHLSHRLLEIYQGLSRVIEQHQPAVAAVEEVFMASNPQSALKLGHARGAALLAAAGPGLPVHDYTARMIKQAVVGYGQADKSQVQQMVQTLLDLSGLPSVDAADGLAVAICHAFRVTTI
jgi:crossover junction endodeoxyribonuclease RuvC